MSYGYPTTRRYPRTLAEAFPCDRAACVERYPHVTTRDYLLGCALAIVIGVTLALLIAMSI